MLAYLKIRVEWKVDKRSNSLNCLFNKEIPCSSNDRSFEIGDLVC